MLNICITGGIATGKSTVCAKLAAAINCDMVSCDRVVHDLYQDDLVLTSIREKFGSEVFSGPELNHPALGKRIFGSAEDRRWLEQLVHPLVLRKVTEWRESLGAANCNIVEVPLLYEVDFPLNRDIDVVVACSAATQLSRLIERDQLDPNQAKSRIDAQLPIPDKIRRADLVVWNEGSLSCLMRQIDLAGARFSKRIK